VARARVGSGICGESRRAAERARRACWAGNHGWVGAGGRARAWDVREVGIERVREVGGVVCRARAGSVRARDPRREAGESGGSLHMALNSCRDKNPIGICLCS
jgi:hypothetical protein